MKWLLWSKPGLVCLGISLSIGGLILLTTIFEFYAWRQLWELDNISVRYSNGSIGIIKSDVYPPMSFGVQFRFKSPSRWNWRLALWPRYGRATNNFRKTYYAFCYLPLWMPLLLFGSVSAFFYHRLQRRRRAGHCLKCDYNLTGNTSGICPECGERI